MMTDYVVEKHFADFSLFVKEKYYDCCSKINSDEKNIKDQRILDTNESDFYFHFLNLWLPVSELMRKKSRIFSWAPK